jgi:hypothetical protein
MYPAACSEFLFRLCDGKVETGIGTHRKKRKKKKRIPLYHACAVEEKKGSQGL